MREKIQIVLLGQDEWHYYVVREDGEFLVSDGPFPTEERARDIAASEHPDLEFVQSVPQEIWPPQA